MTINVLHKDPYIIYVPSVSLNDEIKRLKQYLSGQTVYFLIAPYWHVCDHTLKEYIIFLSNNQPTHHIIILANSNFDQQQFNKLNTQNILCNHNAFVDPNIFKIVESVKQYNAIYNARFNPTKRHYLANKINKLACTTWGFANDSECEYLKQIQQTQDIIVLNNIQNNKIISKKPHEVNLAYSLAYVGLCLSASEGAMYSSIEYLLAGLPIVSTESKGGRDLFFDSNNSITVEENPDLVYSAVQKWISKYDQIDRQSIRHQAIKTQTEHINRFKTLLSSILSKHNISLDIDELYKSKYTNKLLNWYPDLKSFLATIPL
jgi:glycosyltransferase involved in cell wall biosynthesis